MLDLVHSPMELNPPWAWRDPPKLAEVRRGILYTGLESAALEGIARVGKVKSAWAAIGPRLFWGRDDAGWIPYDPKAWDQNLGKRVQERPWPLCNGDEVLALVRWEMQPVLLWWGLWDNQLWMGSPGKVVEVFANARDWFRKRTGGAAVSIGDSFSAPASSRRR